MARTRHWAWGAVIAALCSFAYAKVPGGAHGGGAYSHGGSERATRMEMRGDREARIAGPSGYSYQRADQHGRMQYAGAITPVSAESRPVPRPPSNMPLRSGSIRADVARYNEERGAGRSLQRPADDPRQPEGSPYRN